MLHLRTVFIFLLSIVATSSWAEELPACGKPEVQRVTDLRVIIVKQFKELAKEQIATVVRNSEVGQAKGRNILDLATRAIMERAYVEEYTKNLDARAEMYLKGTASGRTEELNDRCFLRITISGVFDVEDTTEEIPVSLLIRTENRPVAFKKLMAIMDDFGRKVSASISRNLQK